MVLNNNNDDDPRNKNQKKTEVDDSVSLLLSVSAPVVVVVEPPALSFGPDVLSCVLVYIADRVSWNSIAASTKDMHEKIKSNSTPMARIL